MTTNNSMMRNKILSVVSLLTALMLITSCIEKETVIGKVEETDRAQEPELVLIADILKSGESFRDRSVSVRGKVSAGFAFEFVNEQPYMINDGSGEITVITKGIMPREGAEVRVTGDVRMPYQIKGRSYEIAIIEKEREG
jgi:uncharacterized protein YdeI (BOF family)